MFVISDERGFKKLKEGITLEQYQVKYPSAKKCNPCPSIKTMEKWDSEGYCRATDGCKVEPDGICTHGHKSWLLVRGMI